MSYEKVKATSFWVGGRHHSSIISIAGDKTETGQKFLLGIYAQ